MTSFLVATMAESGRVPAPVNPIFPLDGCYSHPVWIPQTVHPRPHNAAPAQPSRWPNPWGKYWGHPVGCYAHLSYIEQRYVESDRCFCPGSRKIKAQRITRATYGDHGVIGKPIAPPNGSKDELPLDTNQEPSQASSSPVEPRSTDASDPVDATRATTGGSSPGATTRARAHPSGPLPLTTSMATTTASIVKPAHLSTPPPIPPATQPLPPRRPLNSAPSKWPSSPARHKKNGKPSRWSPKGGVG